MTDLFADELAAAEQAVTAETTNNGNEIKARAIAKKTERIIVRRAKSEAVLHEILPSSLEMGMSYHVISHGDVDSLSYLIQISNQTPIETMLLSTWCMAMPDVEWIKARLDDGRIGHVDFILGEIFPSQYPDEYEAVIALEVAGKATLKIARNHAKVMAGESPDGLIHFAVESSANVNTNPRIEQTAIHMSQELAEHYREFYAGIKTIDGLRYKKEKPCQP